MSRRKIDWVGIKKAYEKTERPLRVIAKSYGVDHSSISKKAKKTGWVRKTQSVGVTKTVTKTVTEDVVTMSGTATSDKKVVRQLYGELDGVFAKLFFDVVRDEMSKKYYTYDYFSVFIAAEYFQKMMDVREKIPRDGVALSANGQTYVSGELNVYISMANNFVKVTKELGLSPISRGRATLKMVEKTKTNSLFSFLSDSKEEKLVI